jgi:hypothetical protein
MVPNSHVNYFLYVFNRVAYTELYDVYVDPADAVPCRNHPIYSLFPNTHLPRLKPGGHTMAVDLNDTSKAW